MILDVLGYDMVFILLTMGFFCFFYCIAHYVCSYCWLYTQGELIKECMVRVCVSYGERFRDECYKF